MNLSKVSEWSIMPVDAMYPSEEEMEKRIDESIDYILGQSIGCILTTLRLKV